MGGVILRRLFPPLVILRSAQRDEESTPLDDQILRCAQDDMWGGVILRSAQRDEKWIPKQSLEKEISTLNALTAWLQQLNFGSLFDTVLIIMAALFAITFHETCHGFVAWKLGDPTAKRQGRLTLNPIKHIDIAGLLLMAIVKFGWAKPIPVDPRHFKKPKQGMALTALAGPVANVLLAWMALLLQSFVAYAYYCLGGSALQILYLFLQYVAVISAGLAVFNLFPIPPLDGSKVLFAILPDRTYAHLLQYERYGMILLATLLLTGLLDRPLLFLRQGLSDILMRLSHFPIPLLIKYFS